MRVICTVLGFKQKRRVAFSYHVVRIKPIDISLCYCRQSMLLYCRLPLAAFMCPSVRFCTDKLQIWFWTVIKYVKCEEENGRPVHRVTKSQELIDGDAWSVIGQSSSSGRLDNIATLSLVARNHHSATFLFESHSRMSGHKWVWSKFTLKLTHTWIIGWWYWIPHHLISC
jgi:hypothetical protein